MTKIRVLEIAASLFGLVGMAIGSTTFYGALCYAVCVPSLIIIVLHKKLYGLLPMNLAQFAVVLFNLVRVF